MLDTRLTIMSSTSPRSLFRDTPPPTQPATSLTMPQLLELPLHTLLLPELLLSNNNQKKVQNSSRTANISSTI